MERKINIEVLPIGSIKPYWRNPRKNQKTVDALVQSIQKYGFNVPLVLDRNHVIITGHARYKALMQLGWTDVPCVISDMSETLAKEYRIADNKTSEISEWDRQQLEFELREIGDFSFMENFFKGDDIMKGFSFGGVMEQMEKVEPPPVPQGQVFVPKDPEYQKPPVHSRDTDDMPREEDNRVYYPRQTIDEESSPPRYIYPPVQTTPVPPVQTIQHVTEEKIERELKRQNEVIEKSDALKHDNKLMVICPCCHEEFAVDWLEIQRKLSHNKA